MTSSPWTLLEAVAELANAPLTSIAERLREATLPYVGSSALVIFTEDCTGRPQKKAGAEGIISRVSIPELDQLRARVTEGEAWHGEATIAGGQRPVLALTSETKALLTITEPAMPEEPSERESALRTLDYLWQLTARRIQEKVADAPPSYLLESRAASAERLRVTAELVDRHSTTLETMLAALRSNALDDTTARKAVTDLAVTSLVNLRTLSDRTTDLVEEPVAKAFERLREDLRPLMHFSGLDIQFIEPPVNGRALPGEVAHASRAIVRGLVLAIVEQTAVRRVRVQWDCDGVNLLINVRDDGLGELTADSPNISRLNNRVAALDGRMNIEVMAGWGADVQVVLPLDPPSAPVADIGGWGLAEREMEVLQLLAAGQRNRAISAKLHISENTVKFHVRNIFRKLGVGSRTEAIALAHSHGLRAQD
ncbi:LuxR C-terminal-related transcriptional regulator [Arthrobacter sp. NA-172]|uniref:helix-turn-helix transcriptional regulator n=1 Tax=Arthrobacter sp. NA-172 TaxID=3367524 RepID=UPI0037547A9C